jgi:hypothetical protein
MDRVQRAQHHHNRGGAHKIAGRLAAAEGELRTALALDPTRADSRYSLATVLLALGQYGEGFELYESRHDVPSFKNPKPKIPFPEWCGEDVAGRRLLIWPEQGFGDQIQSARFAPVLKGLGATVTLLCAPALVRLFSELGVEVVAASGAIEFPDPDYWVMCESITGRLGATPETLPNEPYLPSVLISRTPGPLRVGLATKGDARHINDAHRSLSVADAGRLRDIPCEIVSLHLEDSGAKDFKETAELIAGLDLVISVDTAVAHLAGALGKPCWILIPAFNTDWRWMRNRSDSPWYPSVRLFRQEIAGDWGPVLGRIEAAVAEAAAAWPGVSLAT